MPPSTRRAAPSGATTASDRAKIPTIICISDVSRPARRQLPEPLMPHQPSTLELRPGAERASGRVAGFATATRLLPWIWLTPTFEQNDVGNVLEIEPVTHTRSIGSMSGVGSPGLRGESVRTTGSFVKKRAGCRRVNGRAALVSGRPSSPCALRSTHAIAVAGHMSLFGTSADGHHLCI